MITPVRPAAKSQRGDNSWRKIPISLIDNQKRANRRRKVVRTLLTTVILHFDRKGRTIAIMQCFYRRLAVPMFLLVSSLICLSQPVRTDNAMLCVAPNSDESVQRCSPGLCASGKVSLKIDDTPVLPWPKVESMKISGLDATTRHRVTIYRVGKPQQSFKFRFSDFEANRACLFLNDLYWTAQLWEPKKAPWCKCK